MKKVTTQTDGRIGASFDDFLEEEGIFEEVQAGALEKVVASQHSDHAAKANQGGDGQAAEHQLQADVVPGTRYSVSPSELAISEWIDGRGCALVWGLSKVSP